MRRLILFRHAKAEARGPGMEDFDRALTERGRADAALMGRVLAREGLVPDLALVSPARRTSETWLAAREAFAAPIPVRLCRELYEASVGAIRAQIRAAEDEAQTLIVVGHNPGIHQTAVDLLREASASSAEIARVAARFPTAAIAALAIDPVGRASLDGLLFAKDHGGGAEA